ncbi:MAG: hypothetical protein ABIK47_05380 [candidate division WOR-3 bacterium]
MDLVLRRDFEVALEVVVWVGHRFVVMALPEVAEGLVIPVAPEAGSYVR